MNHTLEDKLAAARAKIHWYEDAMCCDTRRLIQSPVGPVEVKEINPQRIGDLLKTLKVIQWKLATINDYCLANRMDDCARNELLGRIQACEYIRSIIESEVKP